MLHAGDPMPKPRFSRHRAPWLICAWSLAACACNGPGADWAFYNGTVYTVDAQRRVAQAVVVDEGRIVYVGDDAGVDAFLGLDTRKIDLQGQMLLPSFTDAHVHMLEGGVSLDACDVSKERSAEAILAAIARYAAAHSDAEWIAGSGWSLAAFPDANPSREALDRVVPDRPVYLIAADGHSAWVNSRALAAAGIDRTTPDPPRGRIERDASGEPSGTLRETAMEPVQALAFDVGPLDALRGLRRAVASANEFGITNFVEARSTTSEYDWAYRMLDLAGMLHARVVLSLWLDPARGDEQLAAFANRRSHDFTRHVRADAIKIFADGVAESGTAYLLEPYAGRSDRGAPNFTPEQLAAFATQLDQAGFQLHFHAIGDAAVRMSLDAVAAARERNGPRDARHHIAHLQLVDPRDWPRFAALGVFANVQALWAFPDDYAMELDVPLLGRARTERMYPIGSLASAAAPLAAGSDWPVSSMSPFAAMQVAVTRSSPEQPGGAQLGAGEAVDVATMIAAYTIGGARLMHQEAETGSIEVGKSADLVVLDHDLLAIAPDAIAKTKVLVTLFEGELVYEAKPQAPATSTR
jgi:predicted amidohydrolase YtcJ